MSLQVRGGYATFLMLALLASVSVAEDASHTAAIELRRNMPFVQVMVNGKGPFTFGIDTGTGGEALVSNALAQQLELPAIGEAEVGDPSGLNPRKVRVLGIGSLKVAGVEFKDVKAVEYDPSSREGQCDGILGFVLFRDYLFTLDYPHEQLTLATGSLSPDGGTAVIPFSMPDNVPVVQLAVGAQKIDAHLDSRGMGLSFPEKFAQGLKFVSEPKVIGRGRTVSSNFEIKGAQLASDVRLGGYNFPQPFVEINPVFPVANFGAIPLHNFAVTFDQKSKLVRLVAKDKSIVIAPPQMMRMPPPQAQPQPDH
jgi:hypothetical protein